MRTATNKPTFHFAVTKDTVTTQEVVITQQNGIVNVAVKLAKKTNFASPILHNLLSKEVSYARRMALGIVIMLLGVVVAKNAGHGDNHVLAVLGDALGYSIHGMGLTPFIVWIADKFE